jgi:hypothetical protein
MGNGRSSAREAPRRGPHTSTRGSRTPRRPARGYDRQPGAGMKMCTVSSLVFVVLPNRVRAYPVASTGPCTGRSRARAAPTRRRHQTYCGY